MATEKFGVEIVYVRDLTALSNPDAIKNINLETYCQILLLKIDKPGKQAVLDAIKIIEQHEDVQSAGLNDIITFDPFIDETAEGNILSEEQQIINGEQATAETNSVTSDDEYKARQYAIQQMELSRAWDITTGSSSVLVGVLDTGIDSSHPDLDGNLVTTLGANFTNEAGGAWVDNVGHGTHVAGIIAAEGNNSLGITGVCWNVKMVSLKVFYKTIDPVTGEITAAGNNTSIINAIKYAANNNIMILNLSGGSITVGEDEDPELKATISDYAGLFVCSAGNTSMNTDINSHYPSCYDCSNIISVASVNSFGSLASHSNYGATTVDVAAPGENILSTYPTTMCSASCTDDKHLYENYHSLTGTSMATPHVTGVAALIKSCYPSFTTAQIKQFILNGVVTSTSLSGKVLTGGKVNAFNSLLLAAKAVPSNQNTTLLSGHFKSGSYYYQTACFSKVGTTRTNLAMWNARDAYITLESGEVVWTGTNFNFDKIQDKVVAGDFNGDGYDDIAALYDYGNSQTGIYIWRGSSSGMSALGFVWSSTSFNATCINAKVAAGDFNGDGKDDIAAFYDYGNSETGLFIWRGTATGLTSMGKIWSSTSYVANNITARVTAGDYNGDGKDDISAFYYYGDRYTKQFIWRGTTSGVSLTGDSSRWYSTSFTATQMDYMVTSGDYNFDGKDDIVAFYDMSNDHLRAFLWDGTSTGVSLRNNTGELNIYDRFDISYMRRKLTSVDYDGNNYCDLWCLYNGIHYRIQSSAGEFFVWYL